MSFDTLLKKLNGWINVIQAAVLFTVAIEAILVILIGVASGKLDDPIWVGILVFCAIIYLIILVIRTAYNINFPGSIVEELEAKRELEVKTKMLSRQSAINEFINQMIKGLNAQTCSIDSKEENEDLCDEELQKRLTDLLSPIIYSTDVLLDSTTEKKFAIGIYHEHYNKNPDDYSALYKTESDGTRTFNYRLITDGGILVLKDELGLTELLPKELLDIDTIEGSAYEIKTAIKRTHVNASFSTHSFIHKGEQYGIICSQVPQVCSDEHLDGVLFIIHKGALKYPPDLPEVLYIFNRIITNYISKYNDCIFKGIKAKLDEG